jgi:hypothetical protein
VNDGGKFAVGVLSGGNVTGDETVMGESEEGENMRGGVLEKLHGGWRGTPNCPERGEDG